MVRLPDALRHEPGDEPGWPDSRPRLFRDWPTVPERFVGSDASDPTWFAFLSAGALVLLIACANAANLLLMQGTRRGHEIAVRMSLGAGRWRVIRQLLIESALLASLGVLVGSGLAMLGLQALDNAIPDGMLRYWIRIFRCSV